MLFVIDACDREIIAGSAAAKGGVTGEMVRDLMVALFNAAKKTPHGVKWLSDNGNAYIAADTGDIAGALGLTVLFTPFGVGLVLIEEQTRRIGT